MGTPGQWAERFILAISVSVPAGLVSAHNGADLWTTLGVTYIVGALILLPARILQVVEQDG